MSTPIGFMSPLQLPLIIDREDESGAYVPMRKTTKGLFTLAIYAAAPPQPVPWQAKADIAYLLEAYRYGQFADDMFDHPSADCRSPCKPLREALRRHLDWLESTTVKET